MRRFNDKPTGDYLDALDALRRLPLDLRERAFAESVADEHKQIWVERMAKKYPGLRRVESHACLHRLLRQRCDHMDSCGGWRDHPSLFTARRKAVCYASHPYGITTDDFLELADLVRKHDLDVTIDAELSWHFPGSTVNVLLEHKR